MNPAIEKCLNSADEILREMEYLMAEGLSKDTIGRAYHAMFHAAKAAMLAKGAGEHSRHAIVDAFAETLVKTGLIEEKYHQYFLSAYKARMDSDSGSFGFEDQRQVQTMLVRTREFVDVCRKLCQKLKDGQNL